MGWGDVFKDLDDDGKEKRINKIITQGFLPGAIVYMGMVRDVTGRHLPHKIIWVYKEPMMSAASVRMQPGPATIINVDCHSDPSTDWLSLLTFDGIMCWLPTNLCTLFDR